EADRLIQRRALPVVPPFVEYSLTDSGKALKNVLDAMVNWANNERESVV
ncbi:MAG: winged helix-turn-helix transcriptional regulator, partial [Lentimicrobium sp.]|nr:winged helix-turn-helix transcriptional regulator [Lentimicrobium sp.]